jgi:hypothetical protein
VVTTGWYTESIWCQSQWDHSSGYGNNKYSGSRHGRIGRNNINEYLVDRIRRN